MFAIFADIGVVLVLIILVVIVVSQILVPTLRGGILFPAFRKRSRELQQTIAELTTEQHLLALEQEVKALQKRVHPKTKEGDGGTNAAAASIIVDVAAFMKP